MMDMDKAAKNLCDLRAKRSISREELAKTIGVSVSAISMYENAERMPRDDIKIKISNYYGVTVQDIFFS